MTQEIQTLSAYLEKREKGDGGGDLSNDGSDVLPNLFDAFLFGFGIGRRLFVHVNVELPTLQSLVCLQALNIIGIRMKCNVKST